MAIALTKRQYQCAVLFGHGLTVDEIAARLGVRSASVVTHLVRGRERTGARNSAHLAVMVAVQRERQKSGTVAA